MTCLFLFCCSYQRSNISFIGMFFTEISKAVKTGTNLDTQYNIVASKINQKCTAVHIRYLWVIQFNVVVYLAAEPLFHHLAPNDIEILCLKIFSMYFPSNISC